MSSEDEYAFSLPDFTEQDLAEIDAICASTQQVNSTELSTIDDIEDVVGAALPSPLREYRKHGKLSVSDLVSPAWYVYVFSNPTTYISWHIKV